MKNKIIVIFLLIAITLPMFNFANAASLNSKVTLSNFNYSYEDVTTNFNSILEEAWSIAETTTGLKFSNYLGFKHNTSSSVNNYKLIFSTDSIDVSLDSSTNLPRYVYLRGDCFYFIFSSKFDTDAYSFKFSSYEMSDLYYDKDTPYFYCNHDIYIHNTDTLYTSATVVPDDSIGDSNSDLVLTYEYNEDNTECHIDATLKNGAFTDKIYYSNIAPSISGQGLITKKAFPSERFNSYRKSKFIFPS